MTAQSDACDRGRVLQHEKHLHFDLEKRQFELKLETLEIQADANIFIGTPGKLVDSQAYVRPLSDESSRFRGEFASMKAGKYELERQAIVAQG